MNKITLSLQSDKADAFSESLEFYFGEGKNAEGFLERCIDNLIEAAAQGQFIRSPNFLYTSEA